MHPIYQESPVEFEYNVRSQKKGNARRWRRQYLSPAEVKVGELFYLVGMDGDAYRVHPHVRWRRNYKDGGWEQYEPGTYELRRVPFGPELDDVYAAVRKKHGVGPIRKVLNKLR